MPRPNRDRTVQAEENLARRVAFEREARGWTYEGTAKRMTNVGCPIQSTAIYKIEKGQPRRRISVDELVAFAKVFEFEIEEMLMPVGAVLDDAAKEYVQGAYEAQRAITSAVADAVNVTVGLYRFTVQYGLDAELDVAELLTQMTENVRANEADDDLSVAVKQSFDDVEEAVVRLLDAILKSAEVVVREEGVGNG